MLPPSYWRSIVPIFTSSVFPLYAARPTYPAQLSLSLSARCTGILLLKIPRTTRHDACMRLQPRKLSKVYGGAARPLLRPARHDPEIHGPDGLGGVEGLPSAESGSVRERIETGPAIEAIASAIRQTWNDGAGAKVTLVASGPLTNIALFVSVYTDLFDAIERIVFHGRWDRRRQSFRGSRFVNPRFFFF
jgi:hypothetical protein